MRRWAVRRMKTTVLDDWAIHTIGIAILVPFFLIAIVVVLFFLSPDFNFLSSFWKNLTTELKNANLTNSLLAILEYRTDFVDYRAGNWDWADGDATRHGGETGREPPGY